MTASFNVDTKLKAAIALHEDGKFGEAAALYRDILTRDPNNVTALHLLALIAMQLDNPKMVLALAEQGLRIDATLAVFHQDKASALRRLGFKEKALASIEDAIKLDPKEPDFYDTRAMIERDMRAYDRAVQSLKKAVGLAPDRAKYYNNLAICLSRFGANEEALEHLDDYIRLKPDDAIGYNNKANILKACRRYREAISHYAKSLEINPNIFMGKANKGILHLVLGEYDIGWDLFEDRKPGNQPPEAGRFDITKRWKGETGSAIQLVLYHEQGLGDTVQFCRYLDQIIPTVGKIILQTQAPLLSLLKAKWPNIDIITGNDDVPAYTHQCPLMSLPFIFKTRPETITQAEGYLKADPAKIEAWKEKLPNDGRKKVGLVWAGNPDHMNDHIRSIPLSLLSPFAGLDGIHFISLQKGDAALNQLVSMPAGMHFTHMGDALNDFTDTAALLKNLDLLITVDTSVLHVAGALGCPAWAMLQYDPDWRWMLEGENTAWYKSVKLFRQKRYGHWEDVIAQIAEKLRVL